MQILKDAGYQLRQARITVGSGGLFGTGLFDGPQTNGRFVPEQQTDFIFTVAGEEAWICGKWWNFNSVSNFIDAAIRN